MKKLFIIILICLPFLTLPQSAAKKLILSGGMFVEIFDNPGTYSWFCPTGVTSVDVICIGSGGAGGGTTVSTPGGGGAGGSIAINYNVAVVPGTEYMTVVVGSAVTGSTEDGSTGNPSSFLGETELTRAGGGRGGSSGQNGGTGGTSIASDYYDVRYLGGSGGNGVVGIGSGGGGGGAGTTGNGGNGATVLFGNGTDLYGGDGATGISTHGNGRGGSTFGGGGSGAYKVSTGIMSGGASGGGVVIISYTR